MKVISVLYVLWTVLVCRCGAVAIQPSTFGGVVDSFGRLTNTIKVNIFGWWNISCLGCLIKLRKFLSVDRDTLCGTADYFEDSFMIINHGIRLAATSTMYHSISTKSFLNTSASWQQFRKHSFCCSATAAAVMSIAICTLTFVMKIRLLLIAHETFRD